MRGKSRCRSLNGPENAYWSTAGYLENFHDLNLIEQLWDQLRRAVHARLTNMTTLADLHQMLVEEWDRMRTCGPLMCSPGYLARHIAATEIILSMKP
uniref:Tc1-like transposase DDE domain-containing protein n=1 Tax=Astatotilapia calliptera TaxID=8154 RepID=A0A3P8R706_ASTCA